ncbi:hypothetical protein LPUS_03749 [Lasallia pustulata]|uniref:Uncharacterized protein n=1 Tax=Lasallia pustulata TaxID=136370 RepID=A0A1W5CVW1_9LECA|nr:hypothetical protein LPUS_03749 [Lasallia pustulata]
MSDDDEYYDDDDYFYIDDGPVAEADDLAEHTMHSPVWREHASDDTAEYWSDWAYYTDDYYDQGSPKRQRQRVAGQGITEAKDKDSKGTHVGKRRRKLLPIKDIPELSLGESLDSDTEKSVAAIPTVIWRLKEAHDPIEYPIVTEGEGEKVALLKDWREKVLVATKPGLGNAAEQDLKTQKPNRTAIAVIIGPRPAEITRRGVAAPTLSSKAKNMPSKSKAVQALANGVSISKSSTANPKAASANTRNSVKPPAATKKSSHGTIVLRQRANDFESIGTKRKGPGEVTANGDESMSKKRRAPATKEKENEVIQSAAQSDASSKAGRKRKASDGDGERVPSRAVKRKTSAPKATTAVSGPKKGPAVLTRRNTRSTRD